MVTDFRRLIESLTDHEVRFVVIGGVALVLHGAPRTTVDLDICYDRTPDNLRMLVNALAGLQPSLRGAPPGLPFRMDERTLRSGLNFTLDTELGELDLLGQVTGLGDYAAVAGLATEERLYDRDVMVLGLEGLARAKRAAGRLKDLADLAIISDLRHRRR